MYPGRHCRGGVPLIKVADMMGSLINSHPEFRISPEKHHEYRRTCLEGGELLVTLVGVVGQCAVVPAAMAGWNAARAIAVLRLHDPDDAPFIRLVLLSRPLQHLMQVWSNTTVQTTLNLKEIKELPIPWPPKHERQRIVEMAGALDDKIELNRRMNETLEAMARALFKSWFVERTRIDWREGADGLHPTTFDSSIEILTGGTPKTSVEKYWGGAIPWFSVVDAPSGSDVFVIETERTITDAGVTNSAAKLLPRLTTIISARGTVGECALTGLPMAINQSCYGLRGRYGRGDYYTYFATRHVVADLQRSGHGSVFNTITRDTFKTVSFPLLPVEVTLRFDTAVGPMMERILGNLKESGTLAALRHALLPKLLSGEIRVEEAEALVETAS